MVFVAVQSNNRTPMNIDSWKSKKSGKPRISKRNIYENLTERLNIKGCGEFLRTASCAHHPTLCVLLPSRITLHPKFLWLLLWLWLTLPCCFLFIWFGQCVTFVHVFFCHMVCSYGLFHVSCSYGLFIWFVYLVYMVCSYVFSTGHHEEEERGITKKKMLPAGLLYRLPLSPSPAGKRAAERSASGPTMSQPAQQAPARTTTRQAGEPSASPHNKRQPGEPGASPANQAPARRTI